MSHEGHQTTRATTTPGDDVIEVLLNQHQEIKRLFRAVHDGKGQERDDAFNALRAMLAVHETGEEEVLRPVTRSSVPDGDRIADARMEEENHAKDALARLEQLGPDAPEFDAELRQFERSVLDHAEHEEQEEFPAVRQARSEGQLRAMAKALKTAEAMAPTHPHPNVRSTTANLLTGPFAAMADRVRDAVRQATRD
jgi:hemerythrin superfamily protein